MPACTRCQDRSLRCVADARRSERCGECVRANVYCDVFGFQISEIERLQRKDDELRSEEEAAHALVLQDIQEAADEALRRSQKVSASQARLLRLKQQRTALQLKKQEKLDRGHLRLRESAAEDFAAGLDLFPDNPFLDSGVDPVDPAVLAELAAFGGVDPGVDLDVAAGTPPAAQNNSSGS